MLDVEFNSQVFDKKGELSNNYYGSKYNHWDISQFKDFNIVKTTPGTARFLDSIDNKKIIDKDILVTKLLDYYRDLDKVLNRLLNDSQELMFRRFAYKTVMFKHENMFRVVTNLWEEMYSDASYNYLLQVHPLYEESYGISYVAYFDTHFSQVLYQSLITLEIYFNSSRRLEDIGTYRESNGFRSAEIYRFSWMSEETINQYSYNYLFHQSHEDFHLLQKFPTASLQPLTIP